MALLNKKLKAATLVETLVASVLIVVVFTIASLALNQVVQSSAKANTYQIENELNRIQYLFAHAQVPADYQASYGQWELVITPIKSDQNATFLLQATHGKTGKKLERSLSRL